MKTYELSRADWQKLIDFGLVDCEGNGFACTTSKADNELQISRYFDTFIKLDGYHRIYHVRYYSGCFYPLWCTVPYGMTAKQFKEVKTISKHPKTIHVAN